MNNKGKGAGQSAQMDKIISSCVVYKSLNRFFYMYMYNNVDIYIIIVMINAY